MDINKIFVAAFRYSIEREGRGAQIKCARAIDMEPSYLNTILKGRGKRRGGPDFQQRVAEYFGYRYENFLSLGRIIVEGKSLDEIRATADLLKEKDTSHSRDDQSAPSTDAVEPANLLKKEANARAPQLIAKTLEILQSDTVFSQTLATQIDALHDTITAMSQNVPPAEEGDKSPPPKQKAGGDDLFLTTG